MNPTIKSIYCVYLSPNFTSNLNKKLQKKLIVKKKYIFGCLKLWLRQTVTRFYANCNPTPTSRKPQCI